MHINSASCSFSDCFLQITFVALFHGLSYHFLSFISSPLSLGLIDGQWLPVWSLLMSLIFQPHQSVSVPFKSHQMRWEPLEPRCAGHWDIGSGLIPPQRTQTHVHTQTQIHTRTKTYRSGLFFQGLDIALATVWDWMRKEEMSLLQTLFTSVTLCKLFQDWHAEMAEGMKRVVERFLDLNSEKHTEPVI